MKHTIPFIIAVFASTIFLSGCQKLPFAPNEQEQIQTVSTDTKATSMNHSWKEDTLSINKKKVDSRSTTYNGIQYFADPDTFDESICNHKIQIIDALLAYADTIYPRDTFALHICFGFESLSKDASGSTIVLSMSDSLSFAEVFQIIRCSHASSMCSAEQFGLFYAFCVENELIPAEEISTSDLAEFYKNNRNLTYLDLTLPMLEDIYYKNGDHIPYVQKTVCAFSLWYVERYSFEEYEAFCQDIANGDSSFLSSRKNEWLETIGSDQNYTGTNKIPFTYRADTNHSYCYETDDIIWVWSNEDVRTIGYTNMTRSYTNLIPYIQSDIAEAKTYLHTYIPNVLMKPTIVLDFSKSVTDDNKSTYNINNQTITMVQDWDEVGSSFLQVYCSFLVNGEDRMFRDPVLDDWMTDMLSSIELKNHSREYVITRNLSAGYLKEQGYWDTTNDCYDQTLGLYRNVILNNAHTSETNELEASTSQTTGDEELPSNTIAFSDMEKGAMGKYLTTQKGFDYFVEFCKKEHSQDELNKIYQDTLQWIQDKMI